MDAIVIVRKTGTAISCDGESHQAHAGAVGLNHNAVCRGMQVRRNTSRVGRLCRAGSISGCEDRPARASSSWAPARPKASAAPARRRGARSGTGRQVTVARSSSWSCGASGLNLTAKRKDHSKRPAAKFHGPLFASRIRSARESLRLIDETDELCATDKTVRVASTSMGPALAYSCSASPYHLLTSHSLSCGRPN